MIVKKSETSSKSSKKSESQDKFTVYAAVLVLLLFAALAFFIYRTRIGADVGVAATYIELKQTIVNDSGVVARLSVTVQVADGDEAWLKENQSLLNSHFRKELSTTEAASLRSMEGKLELQNELKRKFNLLLKTDKVQAVMVTELLLQDQRTD
ncbi:flagellar basal body-associated FliL family protein [Undibacterium sp. Di24W]|uniref:flagellar basal body-associated FliL family protein n=1 Tax=Undibacterium sp. Di24W TaxID=3413033 RepID=UPI003BF296D2